MSKAAHEGEATDRMLDDRRGAPLSDRDPHRLGRFTLLSVLGEGGMGRVYLGRGDDGRLVAVKVIRPEIASDGDYRRRFRNEVKRARKVPAFSTAEVIDADPDHEPPYLVVEYVDGPSLADEVARNGPLTAANLHGIAVGVAAALAAIHAAGIIHRDLKPANVLLALGSPKIIDFGLAKPAVDPSALTDGVLGTIPYMAPERFYPAERAKVGPAIDIFAWGAVVAFAATGRSPFSAESTGDVIGRILHGTPDLAGLAEPLRGLVEQTLANDPKRRPTARQLLDRLIEPYVAGLGGSRAAADLAEPLRGIVERALANFPRRRPTALPPLDRLRQRNHGERPWWPKAGNWLAGIAATVIAGVLAVVVVNQLGSSSQGPSNPASPIMTPRPAVGATSSQTSSPMRPTEPTRSPARAKLVNRAWEQASTNVVNLPQLTRFSVACQERQVVLGGGFGFPDVKAAPKAKVLTSQPDLFDPRAWQIEAYTDQQVELHGAAYAICVGDVPGLKRQVVGRRVTAPRSNNESVQVICPSGTVAMGGGFSRPDTTAVYVLGSYPDPTSSSTWILDIEANVEDEDFADRNVSAYAVCVADMESSRRKVHYYDKTWQHGRPYQLPTVACDQGQQSVSGGWHIEGVISEATSNESLDRDGKPGQWIAGATYNGHEHGKITVYVVCAQFSRA